VFVSTPQCWQIHILRRLLVTFSNLRVQQIRSIIFLCSVIHYTEFHFLWLFTHLCPRKMSSNTLHFFIRWRKHNLDMRCWARYISLCSIYLICQKSSHRFLIIFFSVMEDIVLIKIMKWKKGVTVLVQEKRSIYLAIELSLREIYCVLYAHALMCAR